MTITTDPVREPPALPSTDSPSELGRSDDRETRLEGWLILVAFFAAISMIGAVIAAGIAVTRDGGSDSSVSAAGGPMVVDVTLGEFFVEPATLTVPAGTVLTLNVTNEGAMAHDLKLNGESGTAILDPGQTEVVSLGAMEESGEAWCTIAGHREAGMTMQIIVEGTAGPDTGGSATPVAAVVDPNAEPPEGWVPFDPALEPAPGGTEHEIELHATEIEVEVAPGVTQLMWTFGDQVPGPTLRGRVGDLFTVTLINDGTLGHSIDFHASRVAWTDEMRTIEPGESLVYQFQADYAGIYMYHCGTPPTLHHIGNGMYGAIIIDPPDLQPVDHEFVLVQSELYLGPEGQPGDLAKMVDEQWDAVVFNGYYNQYRHAPIRVETDDRIRVWVLDAGPSENSAFHIVGTVFDTVYKEGAYLLQPDDGLGGSQALDLQPAQGGFVEFSFAEDGLYPIVTHKFANVGKGALGLFQAGEVEDTGGSH